MTWRNGRQLSTVATGGNTCSYEYDANGLRARRTNSDGGYTLYYIVDGLTVGEQQYTASGSIRRTMKYLLDENNSPVGVSVRYPSYSAGTWDNYYFLKNLQGDVTAIYNASGALQARYTYDPYGNITSVTNANGAAIAPTAAHIANYNPFRYRGYLYDADTGFYYLKTRYYDPELGRFINADGLASTGDGIQGYNMFAYCNNNPINFCDPDGMSLAAIFESILATTAAIAATVVAVTAVAIYLIDDDVFGKIGDAAVNTFNSIISSIGNIADEVSAQIAQSTRDIVRKLQASFERVTVRKQYASPGEWHHLVAKGAPNAHYARDILIRMGININGPANLIYIKTGLHRRLHTDYYYGWANSVVISAYNAANGNRYLEALYVNRALLAIRQFVLTLNAAAPF